MGTIRKKVANTLIAGALATTGIVAAQAANPQEAAAGACGYSVQGDGFAFASNPCGYSYAAVARSFWYGNRYVSAYWHYNGWARASWHSGGRLWEYTARG